MSSDCFFCPTNSPELKDSSFTITNEKEAPYANPHIKES